MPFRNRSTHTCTFSLSLRIYDAVSCVVAHRVLGQRSRLSKAGDHPGRCNLGKNVQQQIPKRARARAHLLAVALRQARPFAEGLLTRAAGVRNELGFREDTPPGDDPNLVFRIFVLGAADNVPCHVVHCTGRMDEEDRQDLSPLLKDLWVRRR